MKRVYIIGVTGGIGSGKSTVSDYLIKNGYKVLDADAIGREKVNLNNLKIKKLYEELYGDEIKKEKNLDRNKIASIIFRNPEKVHKLNQLTHKTLINEILKMIKDHKNKVSKITKEKIKNEDRFIFVDAALLFESNLYKDCDFIVLIKSSINNRIKRATKRYGKTAADVKNIMKNQLKDSVKQKKSNLVITNNSTVADLHKKVEKFINNIHTYIDV